MDAAVDGIETEIETHAQETWLDQLETARQQFGAFYDGADALIGDELNRLDRELEGYDDEFSGSNGDSTSITLSDSRTAVSE